MIMKNIALLGYMMGVSCVWALSDWEEESSDGDTPFKHLHNQSPSEDYGLFVNTDVEDLGLRLDLSKVFSDEWDDRTSNSSFTVDLLRREQETPISETEEQSRASSAASHSGEDTNQTSTEELLSETEKQPAPSAASHSRKRSRDDDDYNPAKRQKVEVEDDDEV